MSEQVGNVRIIAAGKYLNWRGGGRIDIGRRYFQVQSVGGGSCNGPNWHEQANEISERPWTIKINLQKNLNGTEYLLGPI
jgi:hypothetical protein